MMRRAAIVLSLTLVLVACATAPPPLQWSATAQGSEAEYLSFMENGKSSVSGQAFLAQQGGGVVKAAGREVTLDPATAIGNEWWGKAGKLWVHRSVTPPSANFIKARRTTIADAEGRFEFKDVPPGKYYLRTEVTWEIGNYQPTQGGLVGKQIEVTDEENIDVVLNTFAQ